MSLYDFDKTQVIGRAARDAEMRFMPNGDPVTKFSIPVDRSYKKDKETIKRTIWYTIQVFGKFAETCANIKKGDRLFIEGELQANWDNGGPRIWQDKDGVSKSSFEVTASTVRFLSPKQSAPAEPAAAVDDFPDF